MRLPDFTQFPPLNQLRELMAAELRIWSPFIHWDQFTPDEWKKLNTIGIDVNIEDVVPRRWYLGVQRTENRGVHPGSTDIDCSDEARWRISIPHS